MAIPKHALLSLALFLILANKARADTTFTKDVFHDVPPVNFTKDVFHQVPDDDLIYQGDAHVPEGSTLLSLTKTDSSGAPGSNSAGRVVYSPAVDFTQPWPFAEANFETVISFVIPPNVNGPADGIAFFIAPVGTTIPDGSSGGHLGLFGPSGNSTSPIFAVEFDTYINPDWDPDYSHIGINVNSIRSEKTLPFDSAIGEVVNATIRYDARELLLIVRSSSHSVRFSYDLELGDILPQQVQVGISASTGAYRSVHQIKYWHFYSILMRPTLNDNDDKYIRQMV